MKLLSSLSRTRWVADSSWVIFGNVTGSVAGLLAIRIVSSLCAPSEYGTASLVLALVAFASGCVIGPLLVVHLRIYFDYARRGLGVWFFRTFAAILLASVLVVVAGYVVAALVFARHGKPAYLGYVPHAALLVVSQTCLSSLTNYLEAGRAQRRLALVNILNKVSYPAVVTALLLLVPVTGGSAIVLGQVMAALVAISFAWSPVMRSLSRSSVISREATLSPLLSLLAGSGGALALGYVASWALASADRFVIDYFLTITDVGVYAVNYSLWSVPYLLLNGSLEMVTRPIIYGRASKGEWSGVGQVIVLRLACGAVLCVCGTVLLALAGPFLSRAFIGVEYRSTWGLMITLAVGHCFYVVAYSLMPILLAGMKYRSISGATLTAVIVNLGCNIVLVPRYGLEGAAASTVISYAVLTLVVGLLALAVLHDRGVALRTVVRDLVTAPRAALGL